MINKSNNLTFNIKNNIDNNRKCNRNCIKKEMRDEFIKNDKLSEEDTFFLDEIIELFASCGHFDDMANDLIENNYWTNSLDLINIFYEQEKVKYISISGFTPETGERGITLNVNDFLNKMNTVKQETIKKHPDKAEQCQELYDKLVEKLQVRE